MHILVYGADVLGSLYAARLQAEGQHISLLAREHSLQVIREHGILLEDVLYPRADERSRHGVSFSLAYVTHTF